ncbi:hypothetical protein [Flavobacterium sp. DG2-3]|uniref:hypothetical protein n=1 Tax=Flavobacterium sp. DG2-3 TaxID=3068317 RepID=UPI00273D2F46|nr:hypothetical protein [Flavobacterium sp. DG2-3]MDP5198295.1 hypothetical protein [Flavobacterium sp. DG2-3]
MKNRIVILLLIQMIVASCGSYQKYEPLNVFLETELKKDQKAILVKDKSSNKNTLRIFFRGDGNMEIEEKYRSRLFNQKDYETMYNQYATDSIQKPWTPNDFPKLNLIFENKLGLWNTSFLDKYEASPLDVYFLSEPLFYKNKEYIMFYFDRGNTNDISGTYVHQVIVMKKVDGKWQVIERIADYVYY